MSFLWVDMLWLLLLIPLLVYIYFLIQRRRQKYALRFSSIPLIKHVTVNRPGTGRHITPILFILALIILIVALARPTASALLPSQQGTVILAIDVSMSMRAHDIKPSRLEAAKAAALTFIEKQPKNVRIGVVSFSGYAAVVQAPTTDRESINAAINRLRLQHRTAIGTGLLTSLDAIFEKTSRKTADSSGASVPSDIESTPMPLPPGTYAPAAIILLSDGRNTTGPRPLDIIGQAVDRGVRVYTVGIGSPQGAEINFGEYSIYMRFDEETLKGIAEKTDAQYFKADNEAELLTIYQNLSTQLVLKSEQTELTAIFTGLAAILILISVIFSIFWFGRPL